MRVVSKFSSTMYMLVDHAITEKIQRDTGDIGDSVDDGNFAFRIRMSQSLEWRMLMS